MADDTAPWLPSADVLDQLGIRNPTDEQSATVERFRVQAAAYVERVRADLFVDVDGVRTFTPGADVVGGAVLLAARLNARKGSPAGLASFGEFGPSAVLRLDPDIERMLGVGRYARPAIG